jgi:hypothetical protein
MTVLAADRNTPQRGTESHVDPVKAATTIYAGSLVCLDAAGWAVPGAAATTLVARGRAQSKVVNAGANGAETIETRSGCFRFANSAAGDAITRAEIGDNCYIVDDQTVAKTDGTGTRSIAGKIDDLDAQGVWVRIGQ